MLLLDSEALSALARGPAVRRDRVRALITVMRQRSQPIGTVSAVLAEVIRGRPSDAGLFSAIRRDAVEVYPVDTRTAVRAGQLLGATRSGSEHAIDAFLVAVADLAGGAVIATIDTKDITRLGSHARRVAAASIQL